MADVASLGNVAEGMEVASSDGELLGTVKIIWGGLTNLESALESGRDTGVGVDVVTDPELSEVPEGTAPLGENAPGYVEVEAATEGTFKTIYVPLADVTAIEGDRAILRRTKADALGGVYDHDPAA